MVKRESESEIMIIELKINEKVFLRCSIWYLVYLCLMNGALKFKNEKGIKLFADGKEIERPFYMDINI